MFTSAPALAGRFAAILGAVLLTACGGGGQTAASATGGTTPTQVAGATIDPARIPIGDGKVSTTAPRVGYVYACATPSSSNPAGKAPWISSDGLSWDAGAKLSVKGAVSWISTFSANVANGLNNLSGNGLPNHATGVFPISASDPVYAYDKNPNAIQTAALAWGLPANPVVAAQPVCTDLGAIGVLLSGARLFNALDADGRDAVAHEVQDACGGHPQQAGIYHYHDVSACVGQSGAAGAHSPLVGYIADGFGLYGKLGEGGKELTNADLDECHGHSHALLINGVSVTQYHYHATREYPYTVGCYKGQPVKVH